MKSLLPFLFSVAGIGLLSLESDAASPVHGDTTLLRDFSFISGVDPWLMGTNAAALTRFASRNISRAEVSVESGRGGFVDYFQSHRTLQSQLETESFYRLNGRTVVYGKMSYTNFSGHDMAGSVFIDPTHKPFDIVEDSLTNTGTKHLDLYRLIGGVGIALYRGIAWGTRIDYAAANYAKYKDLRHKNSLMDMVLTTGVYLPIGNVFSIGADYQYRRNTESLVFDTYGKTEKSYLSLISYGSFMGKLEQFGTTGYTGSNYEMPLVDEYNGGGIQVEWRMTKHWAWYHGLEFSGRKGYYGRKSAYTFTYSHHQSHLLGYESRLTWKVLHAVHLWEVRVQSENLLNYENTFSQVINSSGATTYQYYDAVKRGNRLWVDGKVGYTGYFGIRGEMPSWILKTEVQWAHRRQTAYLYPYYRRQNLHSMEGQVNLSRNIGLSHGVLSLSLSTSYLKGGGAPYEDGTYATPSDKQSAPPSMEVDLYREYAYLTAPQYSAGGSIGYHFLLPPARMNVYTRLSVRYRKANGYQIDLRGHDHLLLRMSVGCVF